MLEYGGNAWELWKKRLEEQLLFLEWEEKEGKSAAKDLESARSDIKRDLATGSRLFVIDAGNDPAALRQQYPDRARFLILPALVQVYHFGSPNSAQARESSLRGSVELLISEIHVPHRFHKLFDARRHKNAFGAALSLGTENGPRYQVSLRAGKRYEPWVADIVGAPPK